MRKLGHKFPFAVTVTSSSEFTLFIPPVITLEGFHDLGVLWGVSDWGSRLGFSHWCGGSEAW